MLKKFNEYYLINEEFAKKATMNNKIAKEKFDHYFQILYDNYEPHKNIVNFEWEDSIFSTIITLSSELDVLSERLTIVKDVIDDIIHITETIKIDGNHLNVIKTFNNHTIRFGFDIKENQKEIVYRDDFYNYWSDYTENDLYGKGVDFIIHLNQMVSNRQIKQKWSMIDDGDIIAAIKVEIDDDAQLDLDSNFFLKFLKKYFTKYYFTEIPVNGHGGYNYKFKISLNK